jgi:hypothetical protein
VIVILALYPWYVFELWLLFLVSRMLPKPAHRLGLGFSGCFFSSQKEIANTGTLEIRRMTENDY